MSGINKSAAIIGGGPAGLMAAEVLIQAGLRVDLYDAKPSMGRKFLVAGKGGLNLTHSEPLEQFLTRYGARRPQLEPLLKDFGPEQVRQWAGGLGVETFVGTSGRVFPVGMKTAPLLHAWLARLRSCRGDFPPAPPMARLERGWIPALRNPRRGDLRAGGGGHPGAGRRQLAADRFHRRVDTHSGRARRGGRSIETRQLRL